MHAGDNGPERLPLDARLLSRAVIELNIARRVIGLYPGSHHLVQQALDRAFETFADLFEMRAEIAISVAKDTLLIDEYHLDRKNPVFREFALALSRMSILCVSFVKGMSREEVSGFHDLLARSAEGVSAESLPELVKQCGLRFIRVEAIDYRRISFSAGSTRKGGEDPNLLERYLKCFIDGTLLPPGAEAVVDEVLPEDLAGLMNRQPLVNADPVTYDRVISSYLRTARTPRFTGRELGRLFTFVNGLRPELKKEFLAASARRLAGDTAHLQQALDGVSVDHIIAILESINESGISFPTTLRNVLAKFAQFSHDLPGVASGGLGTIADDLLLSPEIRNLLREEGAAGGAGAYREEIRHLIEADLASGPPDSASIPEAEWSEDFVLYSLGETLMEILASPEPGLVPDECVARYGGLLCELAGKIVAAGQYGQLHDMLGQLVNLQKRGRHPRLAARVLAHCRSPEFVATLVESLREHGRAARVAVRMLCDFYGGRIVPELYDLLRIEPGKSVRRFVIGLLVGLGPVVREESLRRLDDPRWYVRRNVLLVLADSGVAGGEAIAWRHCNDKDPRVRVEAARCLDLAGDARGSSTLREMMRGADTEAARLATAVVGGLGGREFLPDLVSILRRGALRGRDYLEKIPAVWALAKIGGEEAESALLEVLADRSFLARRDLARLKCEAAAALRALRPVAGAPGDTGRDGGLDDE